MPMVFYVARDYSQLRHFIGQSNKQESRGGSLSGRASDWPEREVQGSNPTAAV